ncbi:MAG: transcriptional regulator, LysR family [Firmicutes bacterium]|nr:transcriptional regulator, LysR family [Bacillota bacterium]
MNDNDLIALKMVYEEGSITKAAARLYISQPSLTYRLKRLETDFKVKILNRRSDGSILTAQGEYILQYAEEVLKNLAITKEYVRSMESTIHGTLHLGVSHIFAQYRLPPILRKFKDCFPGIKINLKTELSSRLISLLQKDEVSVAILREKRSWSEKIHLLQEEPVCLVSLQLIHVNDLPSHPWIQYNASTEAKLEWKNWWDEHFSCPPTIIEVHNRETCLQMVSNGLGWALIPEICLKNHRSLFNCLATWKNGKTLSRTTCLIYKDSSLERPVVNTFVKYILDEYKSV